MMSGHFTADQHRRIEENKQKALAKRAVKSHQASTNQIASSVSAPVSPVSCLHGREGGHEAKALSGTTSSFNKPQGRVASTFHAESDSNKTLDRLKSTTGHVYDFNKYSHHRLQDISTIGSTGGLNKSQDGLADPAVGCSKTLDGLTSSIGTSRGIIKTKDSVSTSSDMYTRTENEHTCTGTHSGHTGTHCSHTGTEGGHTRTHVGHTGSLYVNTGTRSVHTETHSGHTGTHAGHTETYSVNTGKHNVNTGTHNVNTGTHGELTGTHCSLETGKLNIGQPVKATLHKSSEPVYSNIASGGKSISGLSAHSHSVKLSNNSSMGTEASSAKLQGTRPVVPSCTSPTGQAGSSYSSEGLLSSRALSSSTNVQSAVAKSHIDYDKIEHNRLQALAKRAEKLSKSPVKGVSQLTCSHPISSFSHSDTISSLHFSHKSPTNLNYCSNPGTLQKNAASFDKTTSLSHPGKALNIAASLDNINTTMPFSNSLSADVNRSSAVTHIRNNHAGLSDMKNEPSSTSLNIFSGISGTPVKGGCFLVSRDRFEVKVGYSAPLVQMFKAMQTKLYDAVTKKWSFKLLEYNSFMTAVRNLRHAVDIEPLPKAIVTTFNGQIRGDNPVRHIPMADLSSVEQSLVNSLMSFQREGVNYSIYKNGRVLIADDMGLGKTIQAICISCYYRTEWPLLVVVPSSVRFDWAQNFQRWVPSLDPQCVNVVVTGKDNCTSGLINILSYDLMSRKADVLKSKRFQVVIMDECHLLKNYKTARCKAAMPLLHNARRVLLLSGTPALSRPSELFTQIDAVCPFLFKIHDFGVRYCAGNKTTWGWDYSGSSNMEELQILLEERIMIRRLKKDVLTELPDKIRQMVLLDPSSIKISKELKTASSLLTGGNLKKMQERGALLDFFHKSGSAKMKAIKSYVEDLLESEKKFLIFAHHGDVLDGIEETVKAKIDKNYMRIDGKTNSEQRNFVCKKFQHNDHIKVAILSITAANAGIDLSSANLVVFAELFWNPGILVQAEDRAHRIGQQDIVSVQYLVAKGTSDDHIWPMIQKKLDVLGKAGLTKDNFSSAETTRLTRQDEITKFLEESFCDDGALTTCDDGNSARDDEEQNFNISPRKVLKQPSILNFTSPARELQPLPTSSTPPKEKKPQGLLKYFSPKKNHGHNQDSDNQSAWACDSIFQGHTDGQGQLCAGQGDELEEFLKDNDDDWDGSDMEPAVKKRRT